mgnify:CR=1 FL=1
MSVSIVAPTPLGPVVVKVEWEQEIISLVGVGTTKVVNGKTYEVYTDSRGGTWLRDPNPPHLTVPEARVTPPSMSPDGVPPPIQRGIYWDFSQETYASLCARTGLDVLTRRGQETFRGVQLVSFDATTLATHLIMPARADIGIQHPDQHDRLAIDMQLLPGPTPRESFLSLSIRGDMRDVARYLIAQGIKRLDNVPLQHQDVTYAVSVVIDARVRVVSFFFGSHLLRVIPL